MVVGDACTGVRIWDELAFGGRRASSCASTVKVIALSGAELIVNAVVEPGEALQRLAAEAAVALGAQRCKLASSECQVLSCAPTAEESGLRHGDAAVAAAIFLSETTLRAVELLVEYYQQLCQ